jgi:glucoamylase
VDKVSSSRVIWRFNNKVRSMAPSRAVRVETLAPAVVHWSTNGWAAVHDTASHDTTLGVHVADIDTLLLLRGDRVTFTFYWPEADRWEGTDFVVVVD